MTLRNRLAAESSPYLLDHADNPVHWQPWDEAALALARQAGKPILLSIGYSACHWCHVMARESFADEETAALMNSCFVNIKVDREERPDLDQIYQAALTELGEQRGWPLTLILTPEGEPFAGGTYFPPEPAYGRPAFKALLQGLATAFAETPEDVRARADEIMAKLAKSGSGRTGGQISSDQADHYAAQVAQGIDPVYGGFGRGPKFPHSMALEMVWQAYLRSGHKPYGDLVALSLEEMGRGGLYDHLGGGFHRYTLDEFWLVPHFEKMLYDNVLLVELMTQVWLDRQTPWLRRQVEETIGWLLRDMRVEGGGFASSLAADSAGYGDRAAGEGAYYVWREEEIDALLGADAALFKRHYDVGPEGNWEGVTILNRSQRHDQGRLEAEETLARARALLLARRRERPAPRRDDKVLADWNGLAIARLAQAACAFGRRDWLDAASEAFTFLCRQMGSPEGLRHSYHAGRSSEIVLLDDYVQMARAALSLFEALGDFELVARAEAWVASIERHFADPAGGGYFTTPSGTNESALRQKSAIETSTPSANGTLVGVLTRLHGLTGKTHYRQRAEAIVTTFSGDLSAHFFSLASLINASALLQGLVQIVIVGEERQALAEVVFETPLPRRLLISLPANAVLPKEHPAAGKTASAGKASAYICVGTSCQLPIDDPNCLRRALADLRWGQTP